MSLSRREFNILSLWAILAFILFGIKPTVWRDEYDRMTAASRAEFATRLREEFLPKWDDWIHSSVNISRLISRR